jgi:hypothetical protein
MKKKVRIYKAGGDTGAYINKTAQWMMQMGGAPDISQLGYPSQQQEQQEMSPDMLMNSVITDLSNQVPEQQIAFKLITIHKLNPVQAKQFINSVKSSLVNSEEEEDEEMAAPINTSSDSLDDEENIIPEEDFETEEEAELVNEDTYEDVDDNQFAADLIMKYGGSKRNYVNSVLKLVKKNLGGDAKSTDTDPIGEDVRDNMKQSFVGSLKNQSIIAKAKEQAEKEYEQLQAMQNNYNQQLALQNFIPEEQDYMQFGGQRRAMRQFNKAMRKIPFGMTGPVTKFDVRKSGLFGRPKEYSMEFGMSPLMQLANNPYLSSMYGYGTTSKTIKTPGRIGTEAIAKTTNKKTTEEVASQNTTDAANTSAKQPTLEEMRAAATAAGDWGYTPPQTNVVDNTTEATSGNASGNTQSSVENENDVVVKPSVKKDKWGRSEGDKWYGFDPESKQFTIGETPEWYNPSQENTNENEIQGSADGFKKFGQAQMQSWAANDPAKYYNPNTGKYEYRPMSALADDELISTAVLGAPNWGMNFGSKGVEFLTNRLIGSGAKGASSKLGSTAAKQFLGKGQNMLNPGQRMLNQGQNMLNRGQGMLNPGQRMLNPPPGFQYQLPFQSGGLVNDPMSDPYGNLQRFVYGGNDIDQADIDDVYSKDTTDPYFQYGGLTQYAGDEEGSETDENYCPPGATNCFPRKTDNVDTPWTVSNPNNVVDNFNPRFGSSVNDRQPKEKTDYEAILAEEKKKWEEEYKQKQSPFGSTPNMLGNFGKQITEGYGYNPLINNRALPGMPQYMGSWDKTMRAPYDKRTGQQFAGMQGFNPNAQISNINVTKTGMLGRPKKYSITYNNNPSGRPEDRRLASSAPSMITPKGTTTDKQNVYSNTEGLGAGATGAIRRGERRTARELARGEKQNLSASSANLDPYAGFPLDHPIRNEKLATNSVKDYLKPSQASPSKLIDGKYDLNGNPISPTSTAPTAPRVEANGRPIGNTTYEQRNRAMSPSPEKLNELYKRDVFDDYKYGGLHKFLPQAEPGLETPVTQDERFERLPIVSAKDAFKPIYDQSLKNLEDKANFEPNEYTVDYKRKDILAGDLSETLPWVNTGLIGSASIVDNFRNKDREAARFEKMNIENLVAVDPSPNKGYEDTNSGLAGDMGQRAYSQSKQYGGAMDDYYEDEEVDMTEEELADFLANGGEVEYL